MHNIPWTKCLLPCLAHGVWAAAVRVAMNVACGPEGSDEASKIRERDTGFDRIAQEIEEKCASGTLGHQCDTKQLGRVEG